MAVTATAVVARAMEVVMMEAEAKTRAVAVTAVARRELPKAPKQHV